MKTLLIILGLTLTSTVSAQVKFLSKTFDNGFKYPVAVFTTDKSVEDSLNRLIRASIGDLETSDFCIGEFGYVQKGPHLQLFLLCNCIDMPTSEHRYLFFNLEVGSLVPQKDLFSPKEYEAALKLISAKIKTHKAITTESQQEFEALIDNLTFESIDIRLSKDGIEIRPMNHNQSEKSPLLISWIDLKPYLQYNFI
jgi:hypothetical protein